MLNPREDPGLAELLDDPIVASLMKSDGVERDHVQRLITEMRRKLITDSPAPLAA